MAGYSLALHLQVFVEQLPPGLLNGHGRPLREVGHHKAGVISVGVGADLGELEAPTVVPDEHAWQLNRFEGRKPAEEVVHPREERAVQPELLVVHVALLDKNSAVSVSDEPARVLNRFERDGTLSIQARASYLKHFWVCH